MGRPKKPKTKTVRLHEETADLAHSLAGLFGMDVAEFLEPVIQKFLESKKVEAITRLSGKKKPTRD